MEETLWSLVARTLSTAGNIERAVFAVMFVFSLISWCLIFYKFNDFRLARRGNAGFLRLFDGADSFGSALTASHALGASPLLSIFKACVESLERRGAPAESSAGDPRKILVKPATAPHEMCALAMREAAASELGRLQRGLGFLATIGSTSPFIGLFGTVWGIMNTFRDLGSADSAKLSVIAPGISAALLATAAGLAVAIPAVMAYNTFLASADRLQDDSDSFIERMSVLVRASGCGEPAAAARAPGANPPAPPQLADAAARPEAQRAAPPRPPGDAPQIPVQGLGGPSA